MQTTGPIETDIVLLGAGHAHVEVLRRFAMKPEPGVRLTLIGREPETPYSGMLPALLRGEYTHDQAHIDLAPLAVAARARLILAEALAVDPVGRRITIAGRPDLTFDLLSIDVGGVPDMPPEAGTPVKPIGRFLDRLAAMEADMPQGTRIAVVGGGPAGVELALALAVRFAGRFRLTLVSQTPEPLMGAPAAARRAARMALVDAGVELASGVTACTMQDGRLPLSDGSHLDVGGALWATGVRGPSFLAESGLACDEAGCIRVDATLRSISHEAVFAAGDCAALEGNPRPKAGVWAVRAGAPLADNLRRASRRERLKAWRPQRDALVLLGLGHGRAIAWRNGLAAAGAWAWRWKDRIDRRWMQMYQGMRMPADPAAPMRCGGCGAKVAAEVLSHALAGLPVSPSPSVPVDLDARQDAAVLKPPAGKLLVQSVDHFRAFLDDPYVFGQVAACHALSDIHAMGARPWTAMAIAAVPYADSTKMRDDLTALLRGATEVLNAEGCTLIGGHTAEAAEMALGFAVTGLVDPGRVMLKSRLHVGDALILTKRLGTGIVLAGHMQGKARAAWLLAALDSMRQGNAAALEVLRRHGAEACTDVTGFGLIGHLSDMLTASAVSAALRLVNLPVLPGARELAAKGIESTLAPDNRRALPLEAEGVEAALLCDPQTSGGLLAGVPAEQAIACLDALHAAGIEAAAIGVVEPQRAMQVRLFKG
ncbi:MAG: selenide, water dikinase SelD [Acetobacteraceae bacterium]